MNIIHNEPTYEYSTKYHAVYQRKYKEDPFKSAIQNIRTSVQNEYATQKHLPICINGIKKTFVERTLSTEV